jgi:hypothetical protein
MGLVKCFEYFDVFNNAIVKISNLKTNVSLTPQLRMAAMIVLLKISRLKCMKAERNSGVISMSNVQKLK